MLILKKPLLFRVEVVHYKEAGIYNRVRMLYRRGLKLMRISKIINLPFNSARWIVEKLKQDGELEYIRK